MFGYDSLRLFLNKEEGSAFSLLAERGFFSVVVFFSCRLFSCSLSSCRCRFFPAAKNSKKFHPKKRIQPY
jgi:hypothetical protein